MGELLATLDEHGLAENTLVIYSSDNGPVLDDGYEDGAIELCGDHRPAGPLRGAKYSLFDGGTRVPMLLRWPGRVAPGRSDALVSHVDFLATFAALVGGTLEDDAAPDSLNLLDVLLGDAAQGRRELVTEGTQGKTVLRQADWSYIPPHPGPAVSPTTHVELGNASQPQLYDLSQDVGQIRNLAMERPDVAERMQARLEELRASRRTRPRP